MGDAVAEAEMQVGDVFVMEDPTSHHFEGEWVIIEISPTHVTGRRADGRREDGATISIPRHRMRITSNVKIIRSHFTIQ